MTQRMLLYSSGIKRAVAFLVFLFPIQVVLSFSPVFKSFVARGLALLIGEYSHQDLPLAEQSNDALLFRLLTLLF